ncbi:MAG: acyl-CoA dehydrogenase [Candidatus Latescibacterota bacterium]|nr:MAG: acyl-CoA dehydrogenase [Candidatus Latescibacterota bacterium]
MSSFFDLSDEERMIQQTAREFADSEIAPVAGQNDAEGRFPKDIIAKLSELGFMGMLIPEKYGGSALGNLCLVLALEEINRVCASTGVTMSVHNSLATSPIIKFGSDYVKETYLPRLATGELLGAYALSEAEAGSDAASLKCRAVKDGDNFVVNGTKSWVTTGANADLYVVMLRTDPEQRASGISSFVVERDTPGLSVGKKEDKLGLRASSTTELVFEDCRIPAKNMLGEEGQGFKIAMATLDGGRIGIGTQAVGIAQACLDASVSYAKEREQFGKKIGEFQAIQWKIADMATGINAARLMVYRAARLRDEDVPHTKEAAMAKLFASEMANRAAREAVQIHGGAGYLKDFPVERYYRDARITEIYEGTSEVQRIVISRAYLGG